MLPENLVTLGLRDDLRRWWGSYRWYYDVVFSHLVSGTEGLSGVRRIELWRYVGERIESVVGELRSLIEERGIEHGVVEYR